MTFPAVEKDVEVDDAVPSDASEGFVVQDLGQIPLEGDISDEVGDIPHEYSGHGEPVFGGYHLSWLQRLPWLT